ncbi:SMC-Scp complex subunit ScpB [Acidihalobacter ferrooxydans]|uniref:SMC-Scp complex subunit ScpB n=1 Tax=Acidihalobacter ferrooxydans TaxID=1765967 RepID=A0A1P8UG96_9GAMM|nr:SMC-Scp complex subunit ScpB [Acidihalobacter ferrooxydans]APZ42877.1 SMC-Scp complex subunit ScpB [Acidihalobacter ferrooxydans]
MDAAQLKRILEAALLAAGEPLPIERMEKLFAGESDAPDRRALRDALKALDEDCAARGYELREVGSGYRYQVRQELSRWVGRLWEERPPRYSRATLETLALIAYRQPVTRGEIEDVRGVAVSSHIIKSLQERDWIRVVGHREVPGRPALYATTRGFLDYFNLKSLDELPPLAELKNIDKLHPELDLNDPDGRADEAAAARPEA